MPVQDVINPFKEQIKTSRDLNLRKSYRGNINALNNDKKKGKIHGQYPWNLKSMEKEVSAKFYTRYKNGNINALNNDKKKGKIHGQYPWNLKSMEKEVSAKFYTRYKNGSNVCFEIAALFHLAIP